MSIPPISLIYFFPSRPSAVRLAMLAFSFVSLAAFGSYLLPFSMEVRYLKVVDHSLTVEEHENRTVEAKAPAPA
ncbi:MAG: hypothetical protein Q8N45_03310 [Anaerolineales bacterium]|nr:hypothetical protein [Anaerolineales bacterium]